MVDIKTLKEKLNIDDYRKIFYALGVEPNESSSEYWTLPTICHNLEVTKDVSHKLYFYLESKRLYCFTHCGNLDIIELVRKRWDLECKRYIFTDIIQWILSVIGLSDEQFEPSNTISQPAWKSSLLPYTTRKSSEFMGRRYDSKVLDLCLPYYHEMFLNDNITKETMQKFKVGWYAPKSQIALPVFTKDNELMGVHCRNTIAKIVDKGYKYIPLKTSEQQYNFKTSEALYGINVNKESIKTHKRVYLFEAPKSVLQCDSMGIHEALGLFGLNCSTLQRDMILSLGINEIIICLDKQYIEPNGDEFEKYIRNVTKIAKIFKGHAKVYSITDMNNLLGYKDSPSDCGREIFDRLYERKFEVA